LLATVVGVTIIAFATTAPEPFVGVVSSTDYRAKLGLGPSSARTCTTPSP
jgi:Ca2+/Na+ antiporter